MFLFKINIPFNMKETFNKICFGLCRPDIVRHLIHGQTAKIPLPLLVLLSGLMMFPLPRIFLECEKYTVLLTF